MSFQAIETFTNSIIGRRASGNLTTKRKGGVEITLRPTEAERELSTEEKLGQVLPNIMGVPYPRSNRAWQSFKLLKVARDATVHLKSRDIYTRNEVDRESLFFYFLNHDSRTYPAAVIKAISHFFPKHPPRWLLHAREIAERDTKFVSLHHPM
jgi:hypothetical protein